MALNKVPTADPVYYRTYSRVINGRKEHIDETFDRALKGTFKLGKYTPEQEQLIDRNVRNKYVLPSGRWLWVGGTSFVENPENYPSAYNCCGIRLEDWGDFAENFDNLHQGSGVGTTVTQEEISNLPPIVSRINLVVKSEPGEYYNPAMQFNNTVITWAATTPNKVYIEVGDTRQGWTLAYTKLFELASKAVEGNCWDVEIDFGYIRPAGTPIKGFGGVANPQQLVPGFTAIAKLLSKAVGRCLNVVEVVLSLNIAGKIAVAGNIRRSARINQGDYNDTLFKTSKDNLWSQNEEGKWVIDPEKDPLVYANHTRLFYVAPTLEEIREAVEKQYYSGEGAIMYVPEALARTNSDLLVSRGLQVLFMEKYEQNPKYAADLLQYLDPNMDDKELYHRMHRFNMNPCGEILG